MAEHDIVRIADVLVTVGAAITVVVMSFWTRF